MSEVVENDGWVNVAFENFEVSVPAVDFGGGISTRQLFGLDELILFSAYNQAVGRLHQFADLGSNIGLHSLVAAKIGFNVVAYEPDPIHASIARKVFDKNGNGNDIHLNEKAVVPENGEGKAQFIRVEGNSTSSHIKGAKNPYGKVQEFQVHTVGIQEVISGSELQKIDVEGLELDLLRGVPETELSKLNAFVEVGSENNAQGILSWAKTYALEVYSQKLNWEMVETLDQMPKNYKEGSILITSRGPVFGRH
jgi:FkbM family methyltransferase